MSNLDMPQLTELETIRAFVARVNARAERTIEQTHRVEGAHYNAMQVELAELEKRLVTSPVE